MQTMLGLLGLALVAALVGSVVLAQGSPQVVDEALPKMRRPQPVCSLPPIRSLENPDGSIVCYVTSAGAISCLRRQP